jgi:P22_AR N-terminal domain
MEKSLKSIEQKQVTFYDDELTAIRADDGQIYGSVRHMCDALGLDIQAQTRRIRRHNILNDGFMVAKMATIKGALGPTFFALISFPYG